MRQSVATSRLVLSPLRRSDRDEVAAMVMEPGLDGYLDDPPDSAAEAAARVDQWLTRPSRRDAVSIHYVARSRGDGGLVGVVQATAQLCPQRGVGACVLGYLVTPRLHRQGYGSELARAFVDELAAAVDPTELVACIRPGHVGSERIAAELGLRWTGEVVDGERVWRQCRRRGPSASEATASAAPAAAGPAA